jgi:signal peptide peptidase SppA
MGANYEAPMDNNQVSTCRGAWRAFWRTFAATAGILAALAIAPLALGGCSSQDSGEIEQQFKPVVIPNSLGVRKLLPDNAPVLLQIKIQGLIGLDSLTRQTIQSQLVESREETLKGDRVKGILLYIDSPGGTVTDADGIYRQLKAYKSQYHVPIYAYIDGLCASGGMYIACAADKIYATPTSVVGSIGVLLPTILNFHQVLTTLGVETKTLTAGKGKDALNPLRPWGPDEGKNYQELIDDFYAAFVEVVTSNRPKVNREKLVADYGAKVFPAAKAEEVGLIDSSTASYDSVLAQLAKDLNLAESTYQVIELQSKNWLFSLFRSSGASSLMRGEVTHRLELPVEYDSRLASQHLYLYRP